MKVTIEKTSNPSIIKFVSVDVRVQGSYEYNNIDEAGDSPLVQQLFYLPFVKKVYLTANFIAIERYNIVDWEDVESEVCAQIQKYLEEGKELIKEKEVKKIAFEVYAESTPNPEVMKFVANKNLVPEHVEFQSIDEAVNAPLAKSLFHFPFVKQIFISENYVSISKYDMVEWTEIVTEIRSHIKNFLADGNPVLSKGFSPVQKEEEKPIVIEDLDDVSQKIVEILDEYIKPAVASDGGNIAFKSYDETTKTVEVILQGACSGCPSSTITLKSGIETMLKEMIPNQIAQVVAINQ